MNPRTSLARLGLAVALAAVVTTGYFAQGTQSDAQANTDSDAVLMVYGMGDASAAASGR